MFIHSFLTRLRLPFSRVNQHEFRHVLEIQKKRQWNRNHWILSLAFPSLFSAGTNTVKKLALYDSGKVETSFFNLNVQNKVNFVLHGSQSATSKSFNQDIFKIVINYIKILVVLIDYLFVLNYDFLCFIAALSFLNNF